MFLFLKSAVMKYKVHKIKFSSVQYIIQWILTSVCLQSFHTDIQNRTFSLFLKVFLYMFTFSPLSLPLAPDNQLLICFLLLEFPFNRTESLFLYYFFVIINKPVMNVQVLVIL